MEKQNTRMAFCCSDPGFPIFLFYSFHFFYFTLLCIFPEVIIPSRSRMVKSITCLLNIVCLSQKQEESLYKNKTTSMAWKVGSYQETLGNWAASFFCSGFRFLSPVTLWTVSPVKSPPSSLRETVTVPSLLQSHSTIECILFATTELGSEVTRDTF